jgi:hypothetical protein
VGRHAVLQAALDSYLAHRSLILAESALAQLRGTFRLVRLWLLTGAAATLAGGLMYATALADRPGDTPATAAATSTLTPVHLTVLANTPPWKLLKGCQPSNKGNITALPALLETSDDSDGHHDGPFTAIVTKTACPATISVAQGEGSYRLPCMPGLGGWLGGGWQVAAGAGAAGPSAVSKPATITEPATALRRCPAIVRMRIV